MDKPLLASIVIWVTTKPNIQLAIRLGLVQAGQLADKYIAEPSQYINSDLFVAIHVC